MATIRKDIKGYFDFNPESNRLGNTVKIKPYLAAVLKGVAQLDFGDDFPK